MKLFKFINYIINISMTQKMLKNLVLYADKEKNINNNVTLRDLQWLLSEFYLFSTSAKKTCCHFTAGDI